MRTAYLALILIASLLISSCKKETPVCGLYYAGTNCSTELRQQFQRTYTGTAVEAGSTLNNFSFDLRSSTQGVGYLDAYNTSANSFRFNLILTPTGSADTYLFVIPSGQTAYGGTLTSGEGVLTTSGSFTFIFTIENSSNVLHQYTFSGTAQ